MRLFVALELPPFERRRLAELPDVQRWVGLERAALNWVPPENLHITLKFLGSVPDERVPEIEEALVGVRTPAPINIRIGGVAFLPPKGPMRVFIANVDGDVGPLRDLQSAIERALVPLGVPSESRPYTPHVTLARPRRDHRVAEDFREDVLEHPGPPGARIAVKSFALMRSDLQPGGPIYTVVARFPLQ